MRGVRDGGGFCAPTFLFECDYDLCVRGWGISFIEILRLGHRNGGASGFPSDRKGEACSA